MSRHCSQSCSSVTSYLTVTTSVFLNGRLIRLGFLFSRSLIIFISQAPTQVLLNQSAPGLVPETSFTSLTLGSDLHSEGSLILPPFLPSQLHFDASRCCGFFLTVSSAFSVGVLTARVHDIYNHFDHHSYEEQLRQTPRQLLGTI